MNPSSASHAATNVRVSGGAMAVSSGGGGNGRRGSASLTLPTVHEEERAQEGQRRAKPETTTTSTNNANGNGCNVESNLFDRRAEDATLPGPQGEINDDNRNGITSSRAGVPSSNAGSVGSFDEDDVVEAPARQQPHPSTTCPTTTVSAPPTPKREDRPQTDQGPEGHEDHEGDAVMTDAAFFGDDTYAAPPAHASRPILPGPFVVFQGVPGDGMANYLDSMPLLEYHGSQPGSRSGSRRGSFAANGGNHASSSTPMGGGDVGGSFMEVDEEDPCEGSGGGSGSGSDLSDEAAASGISSSSRSSGSGSSGSSSSSSSSSLPRQIGPNAGAGPSRASSGGSAHSDGSFQHVADDGGVVLGSSSSSSSSPSSGGGGNANEQDSGDAAAAAASTEAPSSSNASSRAALEGRTTEGGLHLPIPPSMGSACGATSVLPPLGSPGRRGARPRVVSQADEDVAMMPPPPPLARSGTGTESFVVVREEGGDEGEGEGDRSAPAQPEGGGGGSDEDPATATSTSTSTASSGSGVGRRLSSSSNGRPRRRSRRRRSSTSDASTQTASGGLNRTERRAVRRWNAERLERERRQREETVLDGYGYGVRRIGVGPRAATVSEATEEWWQRDGKLAVFESMPRLDAVEGSGGDSSSPSSQRAVRVAHARVVSTLPPGTTVLAARLVTVDSATFEPVPDALLPQGPLGCLRFLQISSPCAGYVLYGRDDGHAFLGPGLPGNYAEPEVWPWRVTCPDGALIREGLELTTAHVDTVPHGSLVRVTRKTVNSMGLSRLRVEAVLPGPSGSSSPGTGDGDGELGGRKVAGWISEALNPLSGQRGPVVQPLPFPVPVRYRVRLPEGAVVRSDVELSSAQIGHAPHGSILTVVGRAFSEHPMDQCVERLRLAGGRGWVSVRLNRAPPMDETVVELVGLDGEYDPEHAGAWHIKERRAVMEELRAAQERAAREEAEAAAASGGASPGGHAGGLQGNHLAATVSARLLRRTLSAAELSSIPDDESEIGAGDGPGGLQGGPNPAAPSTSMAAVPTLFRGGYMGGATAPSLGGMGPGGPGGMAGSGMGAGMAGGGMGGGMLGPSRTETCLICLTEERNSTIVHGGTGHIACCLTCARILKARGDRCPVCRLAIDSVIQQFWA